MFPVFALDDSRASVFKRRKDFIRGFFRLSDRKDPIAETTRCYVVFFDFDYRVLCDSAFGQGYSEDMDLSGVRQFYRSKHLRGIKRNC